MAAAEPLLRPDPARSPIAALAAARRLDDRGLAAVVGVSLPTVRRWMRGTHRPTLQAAVRLAEALGIPVETLAPTPAQEARQGLLDLSAGLSDGARRTWSISKVHDYLRCGAYYYFRHVAEVPEPGSVALALGHAVHRGIEVSYTGTLPDGRPAEPRAAMLDDLEANLPETPAEGAAAGEDGAAAEEAGLEAISEEASALLGLYRSKVAGNVAVRAAEQRTEVDIAGVAFTVVADVITADGVVRDTKVSRRKPSEADIAEDLQATAESLAYRQLYGEPESGIVFDYLLRHKGGPVHVPMPTVRTERDHTRLSRIVAGVAEGVAREAFYPNPDTKYGCRSCPFLEVCRRTY